jgi:hypothetical protein
MEGHERLSAAAKLVNAKEPQKRCPTDSEAPVDQDVDGLREVAGGKELAERAQFLFAV